MGLLDKQSPKHIGLVFSGGGAKGSYQIGVWQAIREAGIEPLITHVSGTSVGALNAALFCIGELDSAKQIWASISSEDVLAVDREKIRSWKDTLRTSDTKIETLANSLGKFFGNNRSDGVFSRNRLEAILDTQIDFSRIQTSPIVTYAACFEKSSLSTKYFKLNGQPVETIRSILLASSAIPVLFESHRVKQQQYFDGGLGDNIPIRALYEEGIRTFIVVNLSRSETIRVEDFSGSHFLEIASQEDMGNLFTGTLNFNKRAVQQRMAQGHADASQVLSNSKDLLVSEDTDS